MAGEIHGVIGRDEAWGMWKPYGERLELDGSLDPDAITAFEAAHILCGSDLETIYAASPYIPNDGSEEWFTTVTRAATEIRDPGFLRVLADSHLAQQQYAQEAREESVRRAPEFVRLMGNAAVALGREGIFTNKQTEVIHNNLVGPDGNPYMQEVPLSQLEIARIALLHDGQTDGYEVATNAATDFAEGTILLPHTMMEDDAKFAVHNRVHERIHGGFVGLEVWDITHDDGRRIPVATVVGHFAYQPSTETADSDDYSDVENCELNEGWTDYVATQLMLVEPRLGAALKDKSLPYRKWAKVVAGIRKASPELFSMVTDSAMVEATPQNPTAKREALREMHDFANSLSGRQDTLTRMFHKKGVMFDYYTKGRKD